MKRCAIYTRKSTDEGLDQQFNSLDAQREACGAYVLSQVGEGWSALPQLYDDGGYSGGSMQRPGLQALLADIARGRIDVVVVYKIDRLTRCLADFARIVELFDKHAVSFVSVTQAFNTTSSMGRLTLNVLLSFAQFEREVTGERIRDTIAASKAKGMWMGGLPPLGYDPPIDRGRVLVVNEQEAATVRLIFEEFLRVRSVHALAEFLASRGIISKVRRRADSSQFGGVALSRGALFYLLQNRIYRGDILHKGQVYPGLHDSIVPAGLFDDVQLRLEMNRSKRTRTTLSTSPLAGKLYLANGERFGPTHSRGAGGRVYRYYVATSKHRLLRSGAKSVRLPAESFESFLRSVVRRAAPDSSNPFEVLRRVDLKANRLCLTICHTLLAEARNCRRPAERIIVADDHTFLWSIPWKFPNRTIVVVGAGQAPKRDLVLIHALRTAHAMLDHDASAQSVSWRASGSSFDERHAYFACLSPAIQKAILEGQQPASLTFSKIARSGLPTCWNEQENWALSRSF